MPRDPSTHYLVLGIPRDADTDSIRSAFRALAQVHHPDRAGPDATARFQRMVEAYQTLSDPQKRRDYDERCRGTCARAGQCARPDAAAPSGAPGGRPSRWPGSPRRPAVEPLDGPEPWADARRTRASSRVPPAAAAQAAAPSTPRALLPLTPWEARRGGRFAVAFPFLRPCGRCGGSGIASPGICSACGGSGRVTDTWQVTLGLPPDLSDGDRFQLRATWPDGRLRILSLQIRVV